MLRTLGLGSSLRSLQTRSISSTALALAKPPKKPINKLLFPRPSSKRTNKQAVDTKTDGPLDSYQLTAQLVRLTSQSRFSDALTLLHTSPPRAATIVVWNVLLNSILQSNNAEGTGAIKRAYEVWMDMKKRGVKPSSRSFGTFLGGAAKIARKLESRGVAKGEGAKEMIGNDVKTKVETVYKQWTVYQSTVQEKTQSKSEEQQSQESGEEVDELTVHPTNQYISFLSSALSLSKDPATSASLLSKLLTTFESIPPPSSPEPVTRNAVTYALTFNALRTALQIANSPTPPPSFPSTQVLLDSALAIFTPLLKSTSLPDSDPLTPQLATSFLSLFLLPPSSVMSLSLQSTILDILADIHGLVPPSELASLAPPVSPSVPQPVSSPAFDAGALKCVMNLLMKWEKLEWVQGVWEQVNEYPERYFASGQNETEIEHAEIVMEAMGKQGDLESAEALLTRLLLESDSASPLKPRLQTLETLLDAALRSGQYESSCRIYSFFSLPSSSPSSSTPSSSPSFEAPFPPSFKATTSFLLTAINTRDKTKIWSSLKSLSSPSTLGGGPFVPLFGPQAFPPSSTTLYSPKKTGLTRKEQVIERIREKRDLKWQLRYGQAVLRALERVLKGKEIGLGENEEEVRRGLGEWKGRVEEWVTKREKAEGVSGKDKGEMELRREGLQMRARERNGEEVVVQEQQPRTLSQEEIERLAAGEKPTGDELVDESEMEDRKVGRKERRMGWWKEREGDSMKEERAIYESRQRRFDRNDSGRSDRDGTRSRRPPFREERAERAPRPSQGRSYDREGRSRSFDRGEYSPRGRGDRDGGRRREGGDRPKRQTTWENTD
ncbi:uncharacterized protein JCM6883_005883 [Sporobolomyces salmoneus]|uniref:uncharacterized protein n=1 Tax=Sporobolomyces salmoneus TaxID=183962 RepID=UPI00317B194C